MGRQRRWSYIFNDKDGGGETGEIGGYVGVGKKGREFDNVSGPFWGLNWDRLRLKGRKDRIEARQLT